MIEIRRILCPVDFSEFSRRAMRHAAALAGWYESRITALHVVPLLPTALAVPASVSALTLQPVQPDLVREQLRQFVAPLAGAVEFDTVVRQGDATASILEQARALPADLIVLGTHGRGGFERWVLGSVTEKVLRKAACPVLTVPPPDASAPERPGPLYRNILCPVDFSETSDRSVAYALSLAEEANARLTMLHVIESLPEREIREHRHFNVSEYRQYVEAEARERLARAVPAEARDWCQARERLGCGKAYREILRVAAEEASDLIVMGVQGRGALGMMLFGSTTNHVVRQATCPVLTVRPG